MAAQINNKEEFEKKLVLSNEQWNYLISKHTVSVKIFTDSYYDYLDYGLTTKDIWLRKRTCDNKETFELKIPKLKNDINSLVDIYDEYTSVEDIKNILNIEGDFSNFLEENFFIFCNLKTTREIIFLIHPDINFSNIGFKFTKDIVTSCDQYDWEYLVCELEYSYGPELSQDAKEKLVKNIFEYYGWVYEYRYGKVLEYLKIFSPVHFTKLVNNFVCPPFLENIAVV